MPKTIPRGDCVRWNTKKATVRLEIRAHSNMTQNKKGTRKGRLRSLSPTGSPHRSSKGDGKGSGDGSANDTPTLTGKSPPGKANRPHCINSRKEVARKDIHLIIGMFPNVQNSNLQVGCSFGDKCAYRDSSKSADEMKKTSNCCNSHHRD